MGDREEIAKSLINNAISGAAFSQVQLGPNESDDATDERPSRWIAKAEFMSAAEGKEGERNLQNLSYSEGHISLQKAACAKLVDIHAFA